MTVTGSVGWWFKRAAGFLLAIWPPGADVAHAMTSRNEHLPERGGGKSAREPDLVGSSFVFFGQVWNGGWSVEWRFGRAGGLLAIRSAGGVVILRLGRRGAGLGHRRGRGHLIGPAAGIRFEDIGLELDRAGL